MHILYLHQYFTTRAGVGGTRSYEFARYLVAQGHRVTMVTAADSLLPWSGGLIRRRQVDGIDVVELRLGYADYQSGTAISYGRRILAFLLFALASVAAVLRARRPDLVFATSTPLTIGIPGIIASVRHRAPLVFEVRDLWPEAPIQMGALRHPLAIVLARWLERAIYHRSAHIVALSPGMRAGIIDAGVPPERISVIPNASDLDLFSPELDGEAFRRKHQLEGKFVCLYFGTMGEANDLFQVVRAAKLLQERGQERIVFLLYGTGRQRPLLEAYAREHGLRNVIFSTAPLEKRAVPRLVAAADLAMTIFKSLPVLATCSPNKFFDTLAAGRAVLVNMPGWLRELVIEHECGVFVRPDDPEELAATVLRLSASPELVACYGRNARRLAERQFDRRLLGAQLLALFERVAAPQ
jgi:glycosyltransferase involved in cell wall biosynthesis